VLYDGYIADAIMPFSSFAGAVVGI
jgi:hypothetical protein